MRQNASMVGRSVGVHDGSNPDFTENGENL
jgi:hypothetical protein